MPRRNSEQRLLSAINCIYATTTGEVSWSVALESVCDFIGARAADLNVGKPITMEYLAFHPARVDPFVLQYMADYMADVKNENPRVHRIYQPMAEGCIVADSDIWTPQEQARMSFFADFLQPWGTHDSLNTWVRRGTDGLPWIALAIHFSKAKCPPQAEERRRLGLLLPHIRRAFGVEEQLEGAIQSKHGLQEMLDHTREAALLLDANARILHANRMAVHILQREDGIHRRGDEHLCLADSHYQSALLSALDRCRSPVRLLDTPGAAPVPQIAVPTKAGPLRLTLHPLSRGSQGHSGAVAVLLIQAPQAYPVEQLQPLRELYGLTPSELQVVQGLVKGRLLKEIAVNQGISYETVWVHLRQVFDKTGTKRQASLVGLVRDMC